MSCTCNENKSPTIIQHEIENKAAENSHKSDQSSFQKSIESHILDPKSSKNSTTSKEEENLCLKLSDPQTSAKNIEEVLLSPVLRQDLNINIDKSNISAALLSNRRQDFRVSDQLEELSNIKNETENTSLTNIEETHNNNPQAEKPCDNVSDITCSDKQLVLKCLSIEIADPFDSNSRSSDEENTLTISKCNDSVKCKPKNCLGSNPLDEENQNINSVLTASNLGDMTVDVSNSRDEKIIQNNDEKTSTLQDSDSCSIVKNNKCSGKNQISPIKMTKLIQTRSRLRMKNASERIPFSYKRSRSENTRSPVKVLTQHKSTMRLREGKTTTARQTAKETCTVKIKSKEKAKTNVKDSHKSSLTPGKIIENIAHNTVNEKKYNSQTIANTEKPKKQVYSNGTDKTQKSKNRIQQNSSNCSIENQLNSNDTVKTKVKCLERKKESVFETSQENVYGQRLRVRSGNSDAKRAKNKLLERKAKTESGLSNNSKLKNILRGSKKQNVTLSKNSTKINQPNGNNVAKKLKLCEEVTTKSNAKVENNTLVRSGSQNSETEQKTNKNDVRKVLPLSIPKRKIVPFVIKRNRDHVRKTSYQIIKTKKSKFNSKKRLVLKISPTNRCKLNSALKLKKLSMSKLAFKKDTDQTVTQKSQRGESVKSSSGNLKYVFNKLKSEVNSTNADGFVSMSPKSLKLIINTKAAAAKRIITIGSTVNIQNNDGSDRENKVQLSAPLVNSDSDELSDYINTECELQSDCVSQSNLISANKTENVDDNESKERIVIKIVKDPTTADSRKVKYVEDENFNSNNNLDKLSKIDHEKKVPIKADKCKDNSYSLNTSTVEQKSIKSIAIAAKNNLNVSQLEDKITPVTPAHKINVGDKKEDTTIAKSLIELKIHQPSPLIESIRTSDPHEDIVLADKKSPQNTSNSADLNAIIEFDNSKQKSSSVHNSHEKLSNGTKIDTMFANAEIIKSSKYSQTSERLFCENENEKEQNKVLISTRKDSETQTKDYFIQPAKTNNIGLDFSEMQECLEIDVLQVYFKYNPNPSVQKIKLLSVLLDINPFDITRYYDKYIYPELSSRMEADDNHNQVNATNKADLQNKVEEEKTSAQPFTKPDQNVTSVIRSCKSEYRKTSANFKKCRESESIRTSANLKKSCESESNKTSEDIKKSPESKCLKTSTGAKNLCENNTLDKPQNIEKSLDSECSKIPANEKDSTEAGCSNEVVLKKYRLRDTLTRVCSDLHISIYKDTMDAHCSRSTAVSTHEKSGEVAGSNVLSNKKINSHFILKRNKINKQAVRKIKKINKQAVLNTSSHITLESIKGKKQHNYFYKYNRNKTFSPQRKQKRTSSRSLVSRLSLGSTNNTTDKMQLPVRRKVLK